MELIKSVIFILSLHIFLYFLHYLGTSTSYMFGLCIHIEVFLPYVKNKIMCEIILKTITALHEMEVVKSHRFDQLALSECFQV